MINIIHRMHGTMGSKLSQKAKIICPPRTGHPITKNILQQFEQGIEIRLHRDCVQKAAQVDTISFALHMTNTIYEEIRETCTAFFY